MNLGEIMKLRIQRYEEVNGYKIIRDDGRIGRKRPGRAICKQCSSEFECDIYNLKYNKGCGCINPCPAPDLEKFINGFEVVEDIGRINGNRRVKVKCKVCSLIFEGQVQNIKVAKSCGCKKGKKVECSFRQSHERLFRIYRNMIKRCYDVKHKSFYNYGAKGIDVCSAWLESPDAFCKWSLGNRYADNLSIDRINGTKGYHPDNCRWITVTEQNRNARTNVLNKDLVRLIRAEDRSIMTVQEIADKYGLCRGTASAVLNYYTWIDI
jgi:hypothetical protein